MQICTRMSDTHFSEITSHVYTICSSHDSISVGILEQHNSKPLTLVLTSYNPFNVFSTHQSSIIIIRNNYALDNRLQCVSNNIFSLDLNVSKNKKYGYLISSLNFGILTNTYNLLYRYHTIQHFQYFFILYNQHLKGKMAVCSNRCRRRDQIIIYYRARINRVFIFL